MITIISALSVFLASAVFGWFCVFAFQNRSQFRYPLTISFTVYVGLSILKPAPSIYAAIYHSPLSDLDAIRAFMFSVCLIFALIQSIEWYRGAR